MKQVTDNDQPFSCSPRVPPAFTVPMTQEEDSLSPSPEPAKRNREADETEARMRKRRKVEDSIPEQWEHEADEPKEVIPLKCPILSVSAAAEKLQQGEVVAFPTETVFGLGADATNERAVAKIFEAKGRPSDNPLIVHVASIEQIDFVEDISDTVQALAEKFWPGPLSIVFQHKAGICERARAGLDTVAVRVPNHPIAQALLQAANVPVAAPSANLSGKPSPTRTEHVIHDLKGRISGVVDGSSCDVGLESTVIRVFEKQGEPPEIVILRPGGITREMLSTVVPNVRLDSALKKDDDVPLAPGMKYRHYAPEAPLVCLNGSDDFFVQTVKKALHSRQRVGVLISRENEFASFFESEENVEVAYLGSRSNVKEISRNLFDCLRRLDQRNVDRLFAETFPDIGLGTALMNRLRKAASNCVMKE